jgi:hypothetical protein
VEAVVAGVVGDADGSGLTPGLAPSSTGDAVGPALAGAGIPVVAAVPAAAAVAVDVWLGCALAEHAPTMRAAPAMASVVRMCTTTTRAVDPVPLGQRPSVRMHR